MRVRPPFGRVRPVGWPDWRGQSVVLVASGPSARDAGIDRARGRARVLCINNSYKLAPWGDALYACDEKWWQAHPEALDFQGLKFGHAEGFKHPDVLPVGIDTVSNQLLATPGRVGGGGNGGFQALNLALQCGARRIALVGYDMCLDRGTHWHGRHEQGLNNPGPGNIRRWRQILDAQAPTLDAAGVQVFNCSPVSALEAYPKCTLEQALHGFSS
jgi:hypothetical protein